MTNPNRRAFICGTASSFLLAGCAKALGPAATATTASAASAIGAGRPLLEERLKALAQEHSFPGLAVAIVEEGRLAYSRGFGLADVDTGREMTGSTLINFGSVTKTVTATAALQLVEAGGLDFDKDVNDYLDFPVRNPAFPETPITLRQLLAHRSSIADADAYGDSYQCGDPTVSLRDFLAGYVAADAPTDHFHRWRPGNTELPQGASAYSNVAFGLIGVLIEAVTGQSYYTFVDRYVFEPLRMDSSGFLLSDIDVADHAVPYAALPLDYDPSRVRGKFLELSRYSPNERPVVPGQPWPFCLYSFATPPDGLMRSSVNEVAQFVAAWSNDGKIANAPSRILKPSTVARALGRDHFGKMLTWSERTTLIGSEEPLPGGPIISHNGGDPGIGTMIGFRPKAGRGFVFAFNRGYDDAFANPLLKVLLEELEG